MRHWGGGSRGILPRTWGLKDIPAPPPPLQTWGGNVAPPPLPPPIFIDASLQFTHYDVCVRSGSYQSRLDALPHLNFNLANVAYAMGRAPYALGGLSFLYLAEDLFFLFFFFFFACRFYSPGGNDNYGGGDADASIGPRALETLGTPLWARVRPVDQRPPYLHKA